MGDYQTGTHDDRSVVAAVSDVAQQWDTTLTLRQWWQILADAGLAFASWPRGCGGTGADRSVERTIRRELMKHHLIGPPPGLGTLMGGPVVADFGSDEQRQRLLPPLANGTEGWCQLFSEPGAGSDLASCATRAEPDGAEWVITGQKVWTSGAVESRRAMLIARTNWDVPKHRGLSYFIIDMNQPGIEVRPLKQMNRRSHFNEVFLTEARVHERDLIGDLHGGWALATATLAFERSGLSSRTTGLVQPEAGEASGNLDRTVGAIYAQARSAEDPEDEAAPGSFHALLHLARTQQRLDDPMIREGLTRLYVHERVTSMTQMRVAAAAKTGRSPGPESSTFKLAWTNGLRLSSSLAMQILGPWAGVDGRDGTPTPGDGRMHMFTLSVPSASIAGGSDEIQRNIIAERGLGLPKDIVVDADVAFREVRRS